MPNHIRAAAWAAVALLSAGECLAQPLVLAEDSAARAVIVADRELRNWREQLAVRDLAEYLFKVTGAVFPVVMAGQEKPGDTCIYVHRIAAEKLGLDLAALGSEEWLMKVAGGNVYLTGGSGEGFLYAVYHFLEDVVGVHWWNACEEFIPQKRTLSVDELDVRRQPAFRIRFSHIAYDRPPTQGAKESMYLLRNRCEYWYSLNPDGDFTWNYHYRSLAMPWGHALLSMVPPALFAEHPDWFAEVDGKRTTAANDLCLSSEGGRGYAAASLKGNIVGSRASNAEKGVPGPFVFSLGREDNAGWCQCARCRETVAASSQTDLMLEFVNSVAAEVGKEFPDAMVCFLAYQGVAAPPRRVKPLPNVVPLYCTEGANQARPMTDPSNAETLAAINGWSGVCENLMFWVYRRTFQRFHGSYGGSSGYDFACPNALAFAADLRVLHSLGALGMFNEHEDNLTQDMRDLKSWMLTKLMEDPEQDEERLLETFLTGYYGAAADPVRRYLTALQQAVERKPSGIWFFADLLAYKHLDLAFLTEADGLFAEAAKAATDWRTETRVGHARLSVDRAILFNWPRLVREWVLQGHEAKDFPLDRAAVLGRHEKALTEQIHLRAGYAGMSAGRGLGELKTDQAIFANRLYWDLPVPERFAETDRKLLFDFPAQCGSFTLGPACRVVDEPQVAGGKVIEVTTEAAALPLKWQYQASWADPTPAERQVSAEQVQNAGYDWFDLGEYNLDTTNSGLVFFAGDSKIAFWGDAVDAGKYELWAQLAFPSSNTVRLARIIAVASSAQADADRTNTVRHKGQEVVIHRPSSAWQVATDPTDTGVRDQWFAPGLDDTAWKPYSVNLDKGWEDQGFPGHDGYAWFRKAVTVPADASRTVTYLHFGAVDEQAWLYVDGQQVGEHTVASTGKPPADLWDQPFALPVALTTGEHLLCVRVHDSAGMGGIWRPVHIVASDTPLTNDEITGLIARTDN